MHAQHNVPAPTAPVSDWPTTRRYPRNLAEAFPDERAASIEVPRLTTAAARWANKVVAVIALGLAMAAIFGGALK